MTVHDAELDAPFETWEHEGRVYHPVGLMQAWVRGYTDPKLHMFHEPPAWTEEFKKWLQQNDSRVGESFVGPPLIIFPDQATVDRFRAEWHETARSRYPGSHL